MVSSNTRIASLFCLLAIAGCTRANARSGDAGATSSQNAVLAGLQLPVAIAGQPPTRMRLEKRMADYAVPGVIVAVVRDNRIAWVRAVGLRRAGGPDSLTRASLMQAASISKPIAALATMRLVERGALSLGDPVNMRLRSWQIPSNAFTERAPVRLEHLLSHTAGATNGAVGIYAPGVATPTLLQALDGIAPSTRPPVRIDFEPGTRHRYAGGGYSILQQMLIDATGKPFPELMHELVFAPAGMSASCFCQPLPASSAARAAAGHDGAGKPIAGDWWTLPEMAAGGLWTTADDLARFMIDVNKAWSADKGSLLSQATARRMLTPGVGGWGLGFDVDSIGSELRYLHTGSNNGYRSIMMAYPARGDGIAILTNGDGGADLRAEIVRAAAEVYGWPGDRPVVRVVNASANPNLSDYAGRFPYSTRFASTLVVLGDSLMGRVNDGALSRLHPEGKDVFFSLAGTTYRFTRDASGTVTRLRASFPDGSDLPAERAKP